MNVRLATLNDKKTILDLLDEFRSDCIEQITGKIGFSDTAITGGTKIFESLLSNANYHIAVLIDQERIVGILTGYTCPMLRSGELRAEVEEFFIKKECRGNDGAQKLMDNFFEWCKTKGVKKVNLESDNELTRAHFFYKKYGFETKAKRFVKKLD